MKFSTTALFGFAAIISSVLAAPTVKRDPALQYLIVKPPSLDVQVGPAAEIIAASLDGHYLYNWQMKGYLTGNITIGPNNGPSGTSAPSQFFFDPQHGSLNRTTEYQRVNMVVSQGSTQYGETFVTGYDYPPWDATWKGTQFSVDPTTGEVKLFGNPSEWMACKEMNTNTGVEFYQLWYGKYGTGPSQCARVLVFVTNTPPS